MNDVLQEKIRLLPESPGCYIMKSGGEIIYVGKAVNLKNRVRQYFHGSATPPRWRAMVSRVDDFDLMLCQTNSGGADAGMQPHQEVPALLQHPSQGRQALPLSAHRPSASTIPALTLARQDGQRDGAKYFGPYIGATAVRQVMDEVRAGLSPAHLQPVRCPGKAPRRPCMHHQIGQCLAPCAGGDHRGGIRAPS